MATEKSDMSVHTHTRTDTVNQRLPNAVPWWRQPIFLLGSGDWFKHVIVSLHSSFDFFSQPPSDPKWIGHFAVILNQILNLLNGLDSANENWSAALVIGQGETTLSLLCAAVNKTAEDGVSQQQQAQDRLCWWDKSKRLVVVVVVVVDLSLAFSSLRHADTWEAESGSVRQNPEPPAGSDGEAVNTEGLLTAEGERRWCVNGH